MTDLDAIANDGRCAHRDARPATDNPHAHGTVEHETWLRGWHTRDLVAEEGRRRRQNVALDRRPAPKGRPRPREGGSLL